MSSRSMRATTLGYHTKAVHEIFSKNLNKAMNPKGIKMREARDSKEHHNSLAIVIALDVTGSMHHIPHHLIKDGLPHLVDSIVKAGIEHPQILFTAIGDHECDNAPLQVGQFESSDELMDKWLEETWLEGNGGGNEGESYLLAWYFAATRTTIDCFEKREEKGFLFTIGDEPTLKTIPVPALKQFLGDGQYDEVKAKDILEEAKKKYHVYHIHVAEGNNGTNPAVPRGWRQLIGDNLIIAQQHEDIPKLISEIVVREHKAQARELNIHDAA